MFGWVTNRQTDWQHVSTLTQRRIEFDGEKGRWEERWDERFLSAKYFRLFIFKKLFFLLFFSPPAFLRTHLASLCAGEEIWKTTLICLAAFTIFRTHFWKWTLFTIFQRLLIKDTAASAAFPLFDTFAKQLAKLVLKTVHKICTFPTSSFDDFFCQARKNNGGKSFDEDEVWWYIWGKLSRIWAAAAASSSSQQTGNEPAGSWNELVTSLIFERDKWMHGWAGLGWAVLFLFLRLAPRTNNISFFRASALLLLLLLTHSVTFVQLSASQTGACSILRARLA